MGVRSPLEKKRETIQRHSFIIHSFTIIERERDEKRLIKKKKHHHGGFGRRRRERRRRSGRGVEVRFISNPLFVIILRRGLHFLNIIFPFFPSLFHLNGDDVFQNSNYSKMGNDARFLSLFSPSGGRRDIVVVLFIIALLFPILLQTESLWAPNRPTIMERRRSKKGASNPP